MNSRPPHTHAPQASSSSHQERFCEFLFDASFPCVGAKSALNKNRITFAECSSLFDSSVPAELCSELAAFSQAYSEPGTSPVSLVAMFHDALRDEAEFEAALWTLLQAMHEHDRAHFEWDASVGSDPSQSDFSLSIAGRAFFVVGMHPAASRLARRAPFPCLVFNFHNQFEALKTSGKYQGMQAAIRSRELQLQGSINPVLAQFGEASEARQYAGRAVTSAWRCPFQAREAQNV